MVCDPGVDADDCLEKEGKHGTAVSEEGSYTQFSVIEVEPEDPLLDWTHQRFGIKKGKGRKGGQGK